MTYRLPNSRKSNFATEPKGAEAVRNKLQEQEAKIARLSQAPPGQDPEGPERPGAVERLQAERQSSRKRQR